MSTPNDPGQVHQEGDLQFDQAEFTEQAHAQTTCTACNNPVSDLYYEAAGKIVCDPCRNKIEQAFYGGSRLGRAFKALVMGTIAAVIGAAIYYVILKMTDRNFALVAIVVGLMVGGAVKAGSGNRGGWFYQLMAVFLSYSAIVGMHVPEMLTLINREFMQAGQRQEAPAEVEAEAPKVEAKTKAKPRTDVKPADKAGAKPAAGSQKEPADKARVENEKEEGRAPDNQVVAHLPKVDKEPPSLATILGAAALLLVLMSVAAYQIPVLIAMQSPISGLIYAFALWEAWKINKKVQLSFNGPFHLGPGDPDALGTEVLVDE